MCPGSLSCRPATRSCPALATSASSSGRWHLGGWGVRVDASSSVACTCAAAHRAAPMQVLHQDHPRRGVWPHRVGETRHLQLGWIAHRHMQQRSGTAAESTTIPLRHAGHFTRGTLTSRSRRRRSCGRCRPSSKCASSPTTATWWNRLRSVPRQAARRWPKNCARPLLCVHGAAASRTTLCGHH